jgi:hypothetical protein
VGIGFMLLFLVGMNVVIPRFFCRVLCPLGAFLGTSPPWRSGASTAIPPSAWIATSA